MSAPLSLAWLESRLGTTFRLCAADTGAELSARLDEATALTATAGAPRQDPFRFVLTTEPGAVAPQGTYLVSGDDLTDEPVFLVPMAPDAEGRGRLEAIFN